MVAAPRSRLLPPPGQPRRSARRSCRRAFPGAKLTGSKAWSGCSTTTTSRAARPVSGRRTVLSTTSRSSATGTAGGRRWLRCWSRPSKVMTRCSVAASRASRRSWRSSSGRPGPRPVGLPATGRRRPGVLGGGTGHRPGPSRQTTRWGTERMGTNVQMVMSPVRKLALVGRPRAGRRAAHGLPVGRARRAPSHAAPAARPALPDVRRLRHRGARPQLFGLAKRRWAPATARPGRSLDQRSWPSC